MINKEYIKEALEEVMDVVESHNVNEYKLLIDIEKPKSLYLFIDDDYTYVEIDYLYKVSRIDEKYMYMSLLDFINFYPDFLKDNGIRMGFANEYIMISDFGYCENENLKRCFENIELDYYENLV